MTPHRRDGRGGSRQRPRPWVSLASGIAGAAFLLSAGTTSAQAPPTRAQAGAAVGLYKDALSACPAGAAGAACEAEARRRFVEVMGCVVHGRREVDLATAEREFTGYAELIAGLLDRPDAAGGEPGPCFAGVAATPGGGGGGGQDGPTLEALRRMREQSEEPPAPPVTPLPEAADEPTPLDQLRRDVEAMRQPRRPGSAGSAPGTTRTMSPGPLQPRTAPGVGSTPDASVYVDPATGAQVPCATPPAPGIAAAARAWQAACAVR